MLIGKTDVSTIITQKRIIQTGRKKEKNGSKRADGGKKSQRASLRR